MAFDRSGMCTDLANMSLIISQANETVTAGFFCAQIFVHNDNHNWPFCSMISSWHCAKNDFNNKSPSCFLLCVFILFVINDITASNSLFACHLEKYKIFVCLLETQIWKCVWTFIIPFDWTFDDFQRHPKIVRIVYLAMQLLSTQYSMFRSWLKCNELKLLRWILHYKCERMISCEFK